MLYVDSYYMLCDLCVIMYSLIPAAKMPRYLQLSNYNSLWIKLLLANKGTPVLHFFSVNLKHTSVFSFSFHASRSLYMLNAGPFIFIVWQSHQDEYECCFCIILHNLERCPLPNFILCCHVLTQTVKASMHKNENQIFIFAVIAN